MITLESGVRNAKNPGRYIFGKGSILQLESLLLDLREDENSYAIYFVDNYFEKNPGPLKNIPKSELDLLIYVDTKHEPKTNDINLFLRKLQKIGKILPIAIIGIGGGSILDIAKAVANLLTNGGKAEDYQGWDLVKKPGVYKIGIPTLSGTGAEATRTCVMTNPKNRLKLGMNSDHTVFDQLIMDPNLTATVPRNQYFYTGMDAYIHCIESLAGNYRNSIGDAFSDQTLKLCREVFQSTDMQTIENRAKLMVASYLGGCAIATSYVGIIHPFSAGLSVVLGIRHCIANCIVMIAMGDFYPKEVNEFLDFTNKQNVKIPQKICKNLSPEQFEDLYRSTIIHEKPLTNALGEDFKKILTKAKVIEIFKRM
ncbi:MAG: alcohol dehydrogenase [Acidiferrobacteraceae bacterium]|nr:alcohol dehydrogenase [Acidiferrobacteraceae bacterium]